MPEIARGTIATSLMLVHIASQVEDHVCNLTQQGTTGVPPDSTWSIQDSLQRNNLSDLFSTYSRQLSLYRTWDHTYRQQHGYVHFRLNLLITSNYFPIADYSITPTQSGQYHYSTYTDYTTNQIIFWVIRRTLSTIIMCSQTSQYWSLLALSHRNWPYLWHSEWWSFENLFKLAHSGLIGAIWSAPPCRLYSSLRKNDGGPPPLRSKDFLDGLPSVTPAQLLQVQESKEIHRRSDLLCIAVFQQGGFAGKEQPINSLAWKEPSNQQFVSQCSCYMVATPACKWGLDIFKTWGYCCNLRQNLNIGWTMSTPGSHGLQR